MKENEEQTYKIKFYFKDESSYELSYSYDSKSQSIEYENVNFGPGKKLKKHLKKQVLDLESALVCAMQQNKIENLTAGNIKLPKEQIKNNLVKIDLGKDFLIDIIPDIFELQNLCENNLKVEVPYVPYMGSKKEINEEKTEKIIKQIDSLYDKSGEKKITFVERGVEEYHLNDNMNSWIQGYVCGYGGDGYQTNEYNTKYANWKLKEIEQDQDQLKTNEQPKIESNPIKEAPDLDSQKSKTDEKISLGGKITRIIFLIILIALVIFLPIYLGIVGLLFSNVAIPIVVFSVEVILITLIVILILSIRDIYCQNGPVQKQLPSVSNSQKNRQENSIDINRNLIGSSTEIPESDKMDGGKTNP